MKKLLYLLLAGIVFVTMSCKDEALDPYPETKYGALVQITELVTPVFNLEDLQNSSFVFKAKDAAGTVAEYRIAVSWNKKDTIQIRTISDWAQNEEKTISISAVEIAQAYGVTVGEFEAGDRFDFVASTTGKDGTVYGIAQLTQELVANPRQQQGLRYVTYVSCPFVAADLAGTYAYTVDDIGMAANETVEVVAGPGENQFTMVDAFGAGKDLVVNVNPATGQVTAPRQQVWDPLAVGYPANYGKGYTQVDAGFAFSCAGSIILNQTVTVDLGSFGSGFITALEKL